MSDFLPLAIEAAKKAGELLKRGFGTEFKIATKKSKQDLVTEYDTAAEKCILDMILKKFPDHQFLAEESGASKGKSGSVLWIIDPLDGTSNFAHKLPFFSVSIGVAVANEIVCGVVYNPMTQELFHAEKGKGAYLNDQRLQVSKARALSESFVATGFPHNVGENPSSCIDQFVHVAKKGCAIRRLGRSRPVLRCRRKVRRLLRNRLAALGYRCWKTDCRRGWRHGDAL